MSEMTPQRKKVVVLASTIPSFSLIALVVTQHLHDSRWLPVFVVAYALVMATLLAYVVMQMVKLKRGAR